MEREKGSSRHIVMLDGREGRVVAYDAYTMRIRVQFDDGAERWVNLENIQREVAREIITRELGS